MKHIDINNKILFALLLGITFLLPAYLLRFSLWGVPTNILEVLTGIAFLVWIARGAKGKELRILWGKNRKIFLLAIFLVGGVVLSTVFSSFWREGLGVLKGWFVFPLLYGFLILVCTAPKKQKRLLHAYYASASLVSLVAILFFVFGHTTFDGRVQAFYLSPNHLALFIAPALFVFLFARAKQKRRMIFLGGALLIGAALFLTQSFGAWIAVFVTTGTVAFFFGRHRTKKHITMGAIAFLLIVSSIFLHPKTEDTFNNFERSPLASRVMIWKASALMVQDNPLFGIGPNTFQQTYLAYQKHFPPYLEWAVPQPHNLFLAFWLQAGVLGLGAFVFLCAVWLRHVGKRARKNTHARIALAMMLYTLLHGLVDTPYWKNDLAFLFWLIFTIGWVSYKQKEKLHTKRKTIETPIETIHEEKKII